MKKTVIAIVSILLLLLIGTFLIIYNLNNEELESNPEMVESTEEKVHSYLTNEKGYTDGELLVIESSRNPKDANIDSIGYTVKAVFADESEANYYYKVEEDQVSQIGNSGGAYKHLEKR